LVICLFHSGHSHNDVDSDIGIAGNYLCNLKLPDFDVFKAELINAFIKNNQAHCDVQQLIGITDYVQMFGQGVKSFEGNNITEKCACF